MCHGFPVPSFRSFFSCDHPDYATKSLEIVLSLWILLLLINWSIDPFSDKFLPSHSSSSVLFFFFLCVSFVSETELKARAQTNQLLLWAQQQPHCSRWFFSCSSISSPRQSTAAAARQSQGLTHCIGMRTNYQVYTSLHLWSVVRYKEEEEAQDDVTIIPHKTVLHGRRATRVREPIAGSWLIAPPLSSNNWIVIICTPVCKYWKPANTIC